MIPACVSHLLPIYSKGRTFRDMINAKTPLLRSCEMLPITLSTIIAVPITPNWDNVLLRTSSPDGVGIWMTEPGGRFPAISKICGIK